MKKIMLILIIGMSILITGCSGEAPEVNQQENIEEENEKEVIEDELKKEEKSQGVYYFDGEVAETKDIKIKITYTKVIQGGEEGNEYGETPVFAIWFEATNNTDEEIDPNEAWFTVFEVIQDKNDQVADELDLSSLPDNAHLDTQSKIIKKDETVESSMAYVLDDETTPITLIAKLGIDGEEIGRYDYKIK